MFTIKMLQCVNQVLFVCGRGFAWSRVDPDIDDGDKPNSIHSKSSHSVFETSPLVQAALRFNLNALQILDFRSELENILSKFGAEILNSVLSENFKSVSKLTTFVQVLNLERLTSNNSFRSLVNEYLSKPHVCSLRFVSFFTNDKAAFIRLQLNN